MQQLKALLHYGCFTHVFLFFLAFLIPTCLYQKREWKREKITQREKLFYIRLRVGWKREKITQREKFFYITLRVGWKHKSVACGSRVFEIERFHTFSLMCEFKPFWM